MSRQEGSPLSDLISMRDYAIRKMFVAADEYKDYVKEVWYTIEEAERSPKVSFDKVFSVDGSKFHIEFQSLSLFLVRALSFLIDFKGKSGVHKVKSLYGTVTPPYKSNDRSILYMEALELELVNELLEEVGYSDDALILADGAMSTIGQCRTYEGSKCGCALRHGSVSEVLNDGGLDGRCKVCLECAVKQNNLRKVIERRSPNLFYVAKKYHSNALFQDEELDDLTILFLVTTYLSSDMDGAGVTIPMRKTIKLPLIGREEEVWFFYAKFKRGGNLYYIEVPREIGLEDAMNFVKEVSPLCTKGVGYPLPLIWAHKSVELPEKTIRPIIEQAYAFFRSGREGL
ncbi:DNA double-strand break repair nuclease NurA [Ignicoccus hospitalis]|uniref:NurA domain-containing protein n=1 Tax=Ignicoccus hospitalis (strain KIN4/I / DSM 18386 / JCM 14125) TaxID=453591 RepID=A8AAG6_IGNH4|nr:DNA double-strand break repair nuclease NurA [Ignicoccus hospitalis]ABU81918.1 hypothetical protein Igni_0736 [Ignicoccus hospitalis KIN4/I]HIH89924.1 DNA double-strand break repair nuclease NurA [Desulfurococcaceae archaeon]